MNNPRRPLWSRLLAVISGSTTALTFTTAAALTTLLSI